MALDLDNTVATAATTIDISANATTTITPVTANPNRIAWPSLHERLALVGTVTTGSAVAHPNGAKAHFEITTDAGTTWRRIATINFQATNDASGLRTQIREVPVGPLDIEPEQEAAGQIRWRVIYDITAVIASALDPVVRFYLANTQGYPAFKD